MESTSRLSCVQPKTIILSQLPSEILLRILSHLSAIEILTLRGVTSRFRALVSRYERSICRPRIKQNTLRLRRDLNYANLSGIPRSEAIRRFITLYLCPCLFLRHDVPGGLHLEHLSAAFMQEYQLHNPFKYTSRDLSRWAWLTLQIDQWLQYRELDIEARPLAVWRHRRARLQSALLDAIDETLGVSERCEKLRRLLERSQSSISLTGNDVIVLFEEILRVPIMYKGEWPPNDPPPTRDACCSQHRGLMPIHSTALRSTIITPKRRPKSNFRAKLVTRAGWTSRLAAHLSHSEIETYNLRAAVVWEAMEVAWESHYRGNR